MASPATFVSSVRKSPAVPLVSSRVTSRMTSPFLVTRLSMRSPGNTVSSVRESSP